MTERRIIQTGIGLDNETLARCDRLRACLGRSRSHVIELALRAGGLDALEREHTDAIVTFNQLVHASGLTQDEYIAAYVEAFGAKTYPPDVTALAEMKFRGSETREQVKRKLERLAGQRREERRRSRAGETIEQEMPATVSPPQPRPLGLRDLRL